MLGHTNNIVNHVSNICESRNAYSIELNKLKEQAKSNMENLEIMKIDLQQLKSEIQSFKDFENKYVTMDELNEVVNDVKNSFELFLNLTPRSDDKLEHVLKNINDLEQRIQTLQQQYESIPVEFAIENTQVPVKRNIPKLNIKTKKS